MNINQKLSKEFSMLQSHVDNIITLLDEDNTVPFIARYRKELTGGVDDQCLRELADRLIYLRNLDKRKDEVRSSITEQGKMTDEISESLAAAETLTEVEDIYRPFKPKRRTRATIAMEAGLKPLAEIFLEQKLGLDALTVKAQDFLNVEKGITTPELAIKGAKDIIAEIISDDAEIRKLLRELTTREGQVTVKIAKDCEAGTYDMYKEYTEPVFKIPSHRILAITRGEKEEYLSVKIEFSEEKACQSIAAKHLILNSPIEQLLKEVIADSYERLIQPSIEREVRAEMFDRASEQAIKMFEINLRPLLLQPPIKDKVVLGLDPGYRTGCKVAVVDGTGKALDYTVVYPTHSESLQAKGKQVLIDLITKHKVDFISN